MTINPIVSYIVALLVVIALSEVMPEAVNAVLVLVLIGILLMRFPAFAGLVNSIGTLGKR